MTRCQCIKPDGNRCTRDASQKKGDNNKFCWQHQNCKPEMTIGYWQPPPGPPQKIPLVEKPQVIPKGTNLQQKQQQLAEKQFAEKQLAEKQKQQQLAEKQFAEKQFAEKQKQLLLAEKQFAEKQKQLLLAEKQLAEKQKQQQVTPSSWPNFYPKKAEIPYDGPINTLTEQYTFLLQKLPIIVANPQQAKIFEVIDHINQINRETMQYIKVKAGPGPYKTSQKGSFAYWTHQYCPLGDQSLKKNELGKGVHGIAYSVLGPVTKCCNESVTFVFKSTNDIVETKQLSNIYLNAQCAKQIISQKITNIVAAEVAALSFCNYLATKSINYNVPYFYGAQMCPTNNTLYMYMQEIPTQFTRLEEKFKKANSLERDAMLLHLALRKSLKKPIHWNEMQCFCRD
jgi:hypothetical protein